VTCDNYFSRDVLLKHARKEGFGLTMTCRRDRLPKGIPRMNLHQQKTTVNPRSQAACFERPIFCIKEHTADGHTGTIQLTSFQSTSSCNIIHVDSLNSLSLFSQKKERGRGKNKLKWSIKMNEVDNCIQRLMERLALWITTSRSVRFLFGHGNAGSWHAPMLHAKRVGEWKLHKPVSFHCFRETLAPQMTHYNPQKRMYPDNEEFRVSTQQHKNRCLMSSLSNGSHSANS